MADMHRVFVRCALLLFSWIFLTGFAPEDQLDLDYIKSIKPEEIDPHGGRLVVAWPDHHDFVARPVFDLTLSASDHDEPILAGAYPMIEISEATGRAGLPAVAVEQRARLFAFTPETATRLAEDLARLQQHRARADAAREAGEESGEYSLSIGAGLGDPGKAMIAVCEMRTAPRVSLWLRVNEAAPYRPVVQSAWLDKMLGGAVSQACRKDQVRRRNSFL